MELKELYNISDYKDSKGMLFNCDCLDLMSKMEDESIDLIITDPPYKIIKGGCTNSAVTFKNADINNLKNGTVFNNNDIKFEDWIPKLYRLLKDGSHCYIFSNDKNLKDILNISEKSGFKLLNILVWKKSKHSPNRYYLKNCEFIVMLRKGKAKNINNMGTFSVLEVNNVKEKTHPSEKPIELIKILVENSSNEDEVIFDPFMGSGTTCLASKLLNRRYIGCELDKEYFDIAIKRLEGEL